jgi:CDP-diglyceride synthetase
LRSGSGNRRFADVRANRRSLRSGANAILRYCKRVHYLLILQLLALLVLANGSPVVAKRFLGARLSHPVDRNAVFCDGRQLFGRSKTLRGLLLSILITSLTAPLIGLSFGVGLLVGVNAMAGDLMSSFIKRRLGLSPSSKAIGLDQIPESLFPLLACRYALPLSAGDIVLCTGSFVVGDILLSRVLFRLHLRERPY